MPLLKPAELLKEVSPRRLRPAYYLAGEERLQREAALKGILKAASPDPFNLQDFHGDSADADEIVSCARTPPMFSSRRVIVLKRAQDLHARARKTLAAYLEDPLPTTTLVLLHDGRPEKGDILEAAARTSGATVIFYALREEEAVAWVRRSAAQKGLDLPESAAEVLVSEAGTDLAVLQQELEKLAAYAMGRPGPQGKETVLEMMGYEKEENVFDFGRAVEKRVLPEALRLLERLQSQEDPFRLLYQISGALDRQLKASRLSAAGATEEEVFRELRVSRYYNPDFLRASRKRPEADLVRGLDRCLETEARLKSSPAASAGIELRQLLIEVCR